MRNALSLAWAALELNASAVRGHLLFRQGRILFCLAFILPVVITAQMLAPTVWFFLPTPGLADRVFPTRIVAAMPPG